ncbi:hypothetical protein CBS147320_6402 [Aspergillus niger]|nr:hypothetical protein CBS133816_7661 [Aspergillus niger]KAI2863666.1 hypothetical protein CBS12448_3701 [Aspergillus niger]KAI2916748.1 hypothetical protein CBS147371_5021 [Aspergillus niger]KAI2924748.1 hypothetical protein CBS147320_6402 [Aspergillus niger]KAI2973569.1 hypothetical protein CBS147324_3934 [Aspergillus niger]
MRFLRVPLNHIYQGTRRLRTSSLLPQTRDSQQFFSKNVLDIPELDAHNIVSSKDTGHVRQAHHHLEDRGALKVNLGFPDPNSDYLQQLVLSLHGQYGHGLPFSHSSSRGWFWDTVVMKLNLQDSSLCTFSNMIALEVEPYRC